MKIWIGIILFFINSESLSQTIKGKVIDSETKQPISNATIYLNEKNTVLTNQQGEFKILDLSIARYTLKISCVGYESAIFSEILVSSGKETELNIALNESFSKLDEVVVKAQKEYGSPINDMATISVRSFSVEQAKRYAAAWGDPGRMALSFAGTSNVNDETNEIVIRGNSPKGLLWKIDGVEVPSPNHFSSEGASGGGISAISTNVLSNSDFYTGAFPAEYGNASSGVFDIKLRKGNSERRESSIQLGFQGIEASTEGPFSKNNKSSYLFNYRYSTLKLIESFGLNVVPTATPNFQDLIFKLFFPFSKTTISLWGLGALSSSDYKANPTVLQIEKSNFYSSGLNIVHRLNEKSYFESIMSFSGNENINSLESKTNTHFIQIAQNKYSTIRLSNQYNNKINNFHSLRLGIIYSNLNYSIVNKFQDDQIKYLKQDGNGSTNSFQAYLQWKYRISPSVTLNTGIHSMILTLNNKYSIEPRLGGKWQIDNKSSINWGFGLHSRLESISTYMFNKSDTVTKKTIQPNRNLEIPRSAHYVIGYEFRPENTWRILSEIYFQKHYKIGVGYSLTNKEISTYSTLNEIDAFNTIELVSKGTGENYGIELTIEKFLTKGFYFLSTTSLFNGTYTTLDRQKRTARFNNNYVQNILAGKEWKIGKKRMNLLGLSLRTTWAGGVRIVPINFDQSIYNQIEILDYSGIYNKEQLSSFFRTDIRISFIKNKSKTTSTFSLDLNNVTNHSNPKSKYFAIPNALIEVNQLGLIPVFNYKLEF